MSDEVIPLDEHRVRRARELTDRIRQAAEDLWVLLVEVYEERHWADLGYDSWRDWAQAELGWSQSRAYQLLDQGRVIRALEEASGSTDVEITEAQARDLKPHLEIVKDAIRQAVADVPEERVAEIVQEVVAEARAVIIQDRDDRAAMAEWATEADPGPDFDWDHDREMLREGGAIRRVTEELARFRSPPEFIADHPRDIDESLLETIRRARQWLDEFLAEWEGQ